MQFTKRPGREPREATSCNVNPPQRPYIREKVHLALKGHNMQHSGRMGQTFSK